MPWSEFEAEYPSLFSEEMGAPAKTFRIAMSALIIKEKLGTSDRETVEQIKENPYLQHFLGFSSYSNEPQFEASMLVHFRERITLELINKVNRFMVKNSREIKEEENTKKKLESETQSQPENRGKLILDASCAPADISYPTDLNLLNQGRKQTEKIIDIAFTFETWKPISEKTKNVHAFVIGTLLEYCEYPCYNIPNPPLDKIVTYNPYKYDSFVYKNNEEPVYHANEVDMINSQNKLFVVKE